MSDWKQVYSGILSSHAGKYKEARGNLVLEHINLPCIAGPRYSTLLSSSQSTEVAYSLFQHLELRNEILAEVKAIRMEYLHQLDPQDQEQDIAVMQHILAATGKRQEDTGDGEDAREEQALPTKVGDYKKGFTAFTAAQWIFKKEMDSYDRERRDIKDPKIIGQRIRIVQQWWESLCDDREAEAEAEAGRAAEKWNKLDLLLSWQINRYRRKNLPTMARDLIQTLHRTTGALVLMFVSHEAGEGQVKMAVLKKTTRFETAPEDGKKPFTALTEASKNWVLNGETILTDYLLTAPVEEDSAEKQEVEISLDKDGNPELPTWGGQKLKVQQNLARAVFQAAYARFMKKPKAKVPWGLLIKSPMEYLDSESIPEGFTMKDPSKWTKADLGLLWDHGQSLEAEEKVIVSFTDCKKEDASLSRQFDRKVEGSSKKRVWVTVEDDSEAEVGGAGVPGPSVTRPSVVGPSGQTMDMGEVPGEATTDVGEQTPEEYQVLVDVVDALPEEESVKWMDKDFPHWATWTWSAKYLPEEIHIDLGALQKAIAELQSARFSSSSRGLEGVLGLGLLLRECSCAQEVEEDDPVRGDDVMDVVGVVVSRLEQCSTGTKEPQGGNGCEGLGGSDEGDEEKEEEEAPP
ncbi:hypothetical protein EDD16DRAFT_1526248 [Pisolithus croceorrhizus]|nr:hypothetical protein EDD16DRAFT_1526248 [Pisolithus croceorrhizus]